VVEWGTGFDLHGITIPRTFSVPKWHVNSELQFVYDLAAVLI